MVFLEQGGRGKPSWSTEARKCLLMEGKAYLCENIGRGIIRNGYLLNAFVDDVLIY